MIRLLTGIGPVLASPAEIGFSATSAAMYSPGRDAIQLSMGLSGTPPAR